MYTMVGSMAVSGPGIVIFFVCLGLGLAGSALLRNVFPFVTGVAVGVYCLFALKVVRQWQKVALLRFGKYLGLRGPGLFWMIPVVDTLSAYVDQRIRVSNVTAESTLTRDTVPVNVDAIVFWVVWNAENQFWKWRILCRRSQ